MEHGDQVSVGIVPRDSAIDARVVGSYRLERRLGRGAQGDVWLGRHVVTGTCAAVKLMRKSLSDATYRESRAIRGLSHPHIVELYEVGPDHLALAWVDGGTLDRRIESGLSLADALRYALQVASALAWAHDHGVLHGDVKPANVLVDRRGNAFLADFGLSRDDGTRVVGGTPRYMAPEVRGGQPAGPPADQYALGRTILHALCGEAPPLNNDEALAGLPDAVPAALARVLERALCADPAGRWPSVAIFAEELRAIELPDRIAFRRLATQRRSSSGFGWSTQPDATTEPVPSVGRADYSLSHLTHHGSLPARQAARFLESTGHIDFGWSLYGRVDRLGPLEAPGALARASELVVILHGTGCSRETWARVALALCRDNAEVVVLIPDLLGYGGSPLRTPLPDHACTTPETLFRAVQEWLALLGVDKLPTVVFGHSLGGLAVLAGDDRKAGAALHRIAVCPPTLAVDSGARRRCRFYALGIGLLGRVPGLVGWIFRNLPDWLASPLGVPVEAELREALARTRPEVFVSVLRGLASTSVPDPRKMLRTMLVFGVADPHSPPALVELLARRARLPLSNIRRLDSPSHNPQSRHSLHPEWTARNITDILLAIDAMLIASRATVAVPAELELPSQPAAETWGCSELSGFGNHHSLRVGAGQTPALRPAVSDQRSAR